MAPSGAGAEAAMAKWKRGAAFLAALALPAAAAAQETTDGETVQEAPAEGPVAQAPAERRVPGTELGANAPSYDTGFQDDESGWGIREHELVVAPATEEQPEEALSGNLPEQRKPDWPGEHLQRSWDFAQPYSFPGVYPNVAANWLTAVGDVNDSTNFVSRVEAELYLLHVGINFLESVDGTRNDETNADLDLRIPISLGKFSELALMPGVSFPIDSRDKSEATTNVRGQVVYGLGIAGFGLQLRAGVTNGTRPAGLLNVDTRLTDTAGLYGALVAYRLLPFLQVRVEGSGEFATVDGQPDRLTLLPGVVFFPWSDARFQLGAMGVIEDVSDGLDFDDPDFGGLLTLGIYFY